MLRAAATLLSCRALPTHFGSQLFRRAPALPTVILMTIHISTPAVTARFTPAASGPLPTLRRILGSVIAWLSFPFVPILLSWVILSAGGQSCASGGPYQIAVECRESDGSQVAAAVILAFVAIFGFALSSGFGVSLLALGVFAIFGGFGAQFLVSFAQGTMSSGLIVGIAFSLFALLFFGVWLWAAPRSIALGSIRATGQKYYSSEQAYDDILRIDPEKAATLVKPRAIDWLISLAVFVVAAGTGTFIALAWIGVI